MNMPIKASVCVMTYNQERFIARCLQSIVDQKCNFDFEIIVGDDFSSDRTREIIEEFAKKYPHILRSILRGKNVGVTRNYIEVHSNAIGEYVAHCDGDDYWYPGKLQYQVDLMDANPNYAQSWCCADVVDDSDKKRKVFPSRAARLIYPEIISYRDIALSYALVGQHSTQIYRRQFWPKFDPSERLLDYWVAFNIALNGDSFYSKRIFGAYRVTSTTSLTRTTSTKKYSVDVLAEVLTKIFDRFPELRPYVKANAVTRTLFSYLRGHDLQAIRETLTRMRDAPIKGVLMMKSVFYFLLQKI